MLNRILLGAIWLVAVLAGYFGIKLLARTILTLPLGGIWVTGILVLIAVSVILLSFIKARKVKG